MSSLILKQLTLTCCCFLLILPCTPKKSSQNRRLHPRSEPHRCLDPRRHRRLRVHPLRTDIHRRLQGQHRCLLHRLHPQPRPELHRRLDPRRPRRLRVRRVHPLRTVIHRRRHVNPLWTVIHRRPRLRLQEKRT